MCGIAKVAPVAFQVSGRGQLRRLGRAEAVGFSDSESCFEIKSSTIPAPLRCKPVEDKRLIPATIGSGHSQIC